MTELQIDPQPANVPYAIECIDVSVRFDSHAKSAHREVITADVLRGLNLAVESGQIVTLLGTSGCGKSTLLRVVSGLQRPMQGTVKLYGTDVSHVPRTGSVGNDRLSFVFQDPALLPWRSVLENVLLPLELRGRHRSPESRDLARKWLDTVGFSERDWSKKPHELSGGMRMRASIARGMITSPQILLLDEPFAALDDVLRSKLNDLVLQIVRQNKCTVLFVTHNISEAVYLSDRIAIMSAGVITEQIAIPWQANRDLSLRSTPEFAELYGVASSALFRTATQHV